LSKNTFISFYLIYALAFIIYPNLAINQYISEYGIQRENFQKISLSNFSSEKQHYLFKQKLDTSQFWIPAPYRAALSYNYIAALDSGETLELEIGNYSVPIRQTILENLSDKKATDSTIKAVAFGNSGAEIILRQADFNKSLTRQEVEYFSVFIDVFGLITFIFACTFFPFKIKKVWKKGLIYLLIISLASVSLWLLVDKIRILLYIYFGVLI
jgi:hypothetical protein